MPFYLSKTSGVTKPQEVLKDTLTRATLTAQQVALNSFDDPVYLDFAIINIGASTLYLRPVENLAEAITIDATYTAIPGNSTFYWRRREKEIALDLWSTTAKVDVRIVALAPAED